jgi:hypothetical protein
MAKVLASRPYDEKDSSIIRDMDGGEYLSDYDMKFLISELNADYETNKTNLGIFAEYISSNPGYIRVESNDAIETAIDLLGKHMVRCGPCQDFYTKVFLPNHHVMDGVMPFKVSEGNCIDIIDRDKVDVVTDQHYLQLVGPLENI